MRGTPKGVVGRGGCFPKQDQQVSETPEGEPAVAWLGVHARKLVFVTVRMPT